MSFEFQLTIILELTMIMEIKMLKKDVFDSTSSFAFNKHGISSILKKIYVCLLSGIAKFSNMKERENVF